MNNDLISRSALHSAICLDTKHGTYGEFMDGSEVSFTSKEVHAMIDEAPAAENGPKWISVKDRLPEPVKPVLAYGHFDATMTAYWDGVRWHTTWDDSLLTDGFITHWMPLPELPKEG